MPNIQGCKSGNGTRKCGAESGSANEVRYIVCTVQAFEKTDRRGAAINGSEVRNMHVERGTAWIWKRKG
jgi:hypothetical protein